MYFIAVVLPQPLNEKIMEHKHWMKDKHNCKVGLKSPAHITIAPPFWMEEEKEQQLLRDIETIAHSIPAFSLSTNHFSAFKPRTIFVAVQQNEQLNQLKKTADKFFLNTDYKMKIENRPFHPHITIATRDLHKKAFSEAWPYFESKEFEATFEVTGLSLLRHDGRCWDVIYTAPFTSSSGDFAKPQ